MAKKIAILLPFKLKITVVQNTQMSALYVYHNIQNKQDFWVVIINFAMIALING